MTERAESMLWSNPPTKQTTTDELQALDPDTKRTRNEGY